MKTVILATLLCCGAICLFAQPNNSPAYNQSDTKANAQPSPPAKNSEESTANTEAAKSSPPYWYASSEWWLVIIAALTGAAIAYQASEMARTTKVMERSTALQEVSMRQWISISPVEIKTDSNTDTECTLRVTFDILNPTKMVLNLNWIVMRFGGRKQSSTLAGHALAPDENYPMRTMLALRGDDFANYRNYRLALPIVVTVGYTDAFGKQRKQPNGCTALCGPHGVISLSPYMGSLPEDEIETGDANQAN